MQCNSSLRCYHSRMLWWCLWLFQLRISNPRALLLSSRRFESYGTKSLILMAQPKWHEDAMTCCNTVLENQSCWLPLYIVVCKRASHFSAIIMSIIEPQKWLWADGFGCTSCMFEALLRSLIIKCFLAIAAKWSRCASNPVPEIELLWIKWKNAGKLVEDNKMIAACL